VGASRCGAVDSESPLTPSTNPDPRFYVLALQGEERFQRLASNALGMSYEVALNAQDCASFHGLHAHSAVDS